MSNTTKPLSDRDADQTLQHVYNIDDASLTVSGFVTAKVGNKITVATSTTTVPGDTQTFSFFDNSIALYVLTLIYTDSTQQVLVSVERTA